MTNAMIILLQRIELMNQGVLHGTGRVFQYEDADGNTVEVEEPEEIHTYEAWKHLGYQVRKGEKSSIKFVIWKHTGGRTKDDGTEGKEHMFMKMSSFFTKAQVDPIQ